ncbi:MAG: hypothetical protein MZW92_64065 [Comamonadaceae bacterium]|nr:hypothetical protein [Comamonadaceae bacterium]
MRNLRVAHALAAARARRRAVAQGAGGARLHPGDPAAQAAGDPATCAPCPKSASVAIHFDPRACRWQRLLAVEDAVIGNLVATPAAAPARAEHARTSRPGPAAAGMHGGDRGHDLRLLRRC